MFKKNRVQLQRSLFGTSMILSESLQEHLALTWAQVFRKEVFELIDEELFAPLYSEEASRPNAPVNVLMGLEILKAGRGLSDEEMYETLCFDVRMRFALGQEDWGADLPFQLRTLYNFRRRVREYAAESGENLYQKVFEQVTDEQLRKFEVQTGWQRMDSTQVLSNLAQTGRVELLISVLQKVVKGLGKEERKHWEKEAEYYLRKRPHEIGYRIRRAEVNGHLLKIGKMLAKLSEVLDEGSEAHVLAQRVLEEQYQIEGETLAIRPAAEVPADSLQSPHDPDATFRIKNDEVYAGGYVANVSETFAEENAVQLITDIQVASNVTDDSDLLKQSLQNQKERGLDVQDVVTDGGYTGPNSENYCNDNDITLRPTTIRGGKSRNGNLGWEAYRWELDENGLPVRVTCPQGLVGMLYPSKTEGRLLARFSDDDSCRACPLLESCRIQLRKRNGPTINLTRRNIEVALMRQRLRPEDKSIRSPVEATVRSLKWSLRKDKLTVRGLSSALMHFSASALMVNARRLHAYYLETSSDNGVFRWILSKKWLLFPPGTFSGPLRAVFQRFHFHSSFSPSILSTLPAFDTLSF